jgi:GAF domain-containing protein/HAMP domain-containing protein
MTDKQNLSASTSKEIQNAFRFSLAMAISMTLISVLLLIIGGLPKGILDLTSFAILVSLTAIISTWLSRRGQHITGILLLIGSLLLVCLLTSLIFSGFGPVLASVTLLISFGAGSSALPRKYANIVNAVSILLALTFMVLDIFEPFPRQPNEMPTLTWSVAGILFLVFGLGILRNFNQYNFRTKLIISFMLSSAITLGILAVFNQRTTTNILTNNLGRELKGIAETRGNRIGDLINEQINKITVLGLNEVVQNSIQQQLIAYANNDEAIQAEIERFDQLWQTADAADNDSFPLITERLSNPAAQELVEFQNAFPYHAEVFVTDLHGALVASSNRTSDYNQADENWWQAAYNNGNGAVFISDPEFDESVGAYSLLIAQPVLDKQSDQLIGIMRTTFLVVALQEILQNPIGETGGADLYLPGDPPQYIHQGQYKSVETEFYNQLVESSNQNYAEMTYDDAESLLSLAPVSSQEYNPAIDELGWFVVAYQHADEILTPITTQTRTALGLVIVIIALGAGLAVVLAQVLVAPISRLTATALEVASGDLTIQAEVTTQDEVGTLANAFNEMTSRLRSILASLEERVANRTRDLELASEVGRRLSQVRETDVMLTEAVEIIRDRFDLYYTQVYLTDPTGRLLVLHAGTGDVGQTLLQRNHRLPIDLGSLNGIAATERRAVLVEDTETSPLHRPNPLLPDTRSEVVVPLVVGTRVVGVLDMQSVQPGAFSAENLPAFQALAGQLAIAITNANLFEEAEQAREAMERQTQRLVSSGWQDFLDAIERSERLAYTFDRKNVTPLPEPLPESHDETTLVMPIRVAGASVGQVLMQRETAWTEDDFAITNAITYQVAQQIENLRLLAQSEQYQYEAQQALQRLTREGWEEFQDQLDTAPGFVYQNHEVRPLTSSDENLDEALSYEIRVRNEAIGKLSLIGKETLSEDDTELVAAVNEQLSAHLENLRLSSQTEQALAETEELYRGSAQLVQARTYDEILEALVHATRLQELDLISLMLVDAQDPAGNPESFILVSNWAKGTLPETIPTGARLGIDNLPMVRNLKTNQPILIPDYYAAGLSEESLERVKQTGAQGAAVLPLYVGDRMIGFITAASAQVFGWSEEDVHQAMTFAGQAATAIQNQLLFEQTQTTLAQTEMLYEIGRRLNQATNETEILAAVNMPEFGCTQTSLMYIDQDKSGKPEWLTMVAAWAKERSGESPVGRRFPGENYPLTSALLASPDKPLTFSDIVNAEDIDEGLRSTWLDAGMNAIVIIPLGQTGQWQGLLTFGWDTPHEFSDQEMTIFEGLISLATPVVQSNRLFGQVQIRAQREQALRRITQAVRSSTDPATIMRTAVRELGTALGRQTQIRLTESALQSAESDNGKDQAQN